MNRKRMEGVKKGDERPKKRQENGRRRKGKGRAIEGGSERSKNLAHLLSY